MFFGSRHAGDVGSERGQLADKIFIAPIKEVDMGNRARFGSEHRLLILVGTFFEKRYRTPRSAPPPDWKATGERFRDPVSGKMVDVRFNPATGERAYINED